MFAPTSGARVGARFGVSRTLIGLFTSRSSRGMGMLFSNLIGGLAAKLRDSELDVGSWIEEPTENADFGRIAAQTAKQVIIQKVREAERDSQIDEFNEICERGLDASPTNELLIEESIIGWKEYEMEVMRDLDDNVVIICSIENLDPMGVHTGDSITVAPAQTLTDREYQALRDAARTVLDAVGVATGGANVQFAVNPEDGRVLIIEMNPRVSRSSALASKATGFPIAKIAAKLAVGYTLDEITNDITKQTPACFEPTIDYCVVKIPRWTFEKFPETPDLLTTSMKSVGETMAIGRTFKEAFQKGMRSLETGRMGFGFDGKEEMQDMDEDDLHLGLTRPNSRRMAFLFEALRRGLEIDHIFDLTKIDPWFLTNLKEIVVAGEEVAARRRSVRGTADSRPHRPAGQTGVHPRVGHLRKRAGGGDSH